jgi:hypothetical protein
MTKHENIAAPAGIDLDKPLTGEDLMRAVFKRPDLSEAAREAEISYVMRGSGEIIVCGGDFDAMAEYANRHAGLSQFSNGEDAGQPAPTDEKVAEACFAVSPDDFKEEDGWVDYLRYDGAVVRAFLAANPAAVAPSDATGKADDLAKVGYFVREAGAWVATSSDDPRATVLYRKTDAENSATSAAGRVALPTNADDAQAMALLGVKYLEQHAPDRLKATSAADAKDAERYRFLRDEECNNAHLAPYIARDCKNSRFGAAWLHGDEADAAIDSAMAASRKDGEGSKSQSAPASAPDWAAQGYVVGATVEQDAGTSWAARGVITCVHSNGALDVQVDGKAYGWSATRCKPVQARPAAANAGSLPGDWTVEWDAYSAPGTIRLKSPKWGGCFVSEPKPYDISLPALMFRLLRDILNDRTPAADTAGQDAKDAARYRWLRARENNLDAVADGDTMLFGECLDHAIDTEIAARAAAVGTAGQGGAA